MPAAYLVRLVEALGAPYGLERSVKITSGALADDRCLISVGRAALGPDPIDRLGDIGRELRMPTDFADTLADVFSRSDIVHFGYESAQGRDVYKVYFEYAGDVRQAMATAASGPVLVHLAYKWAPLFPDSRAVTRYTWVPCRTPADLETKVLDLVSANQAPVGRRCMLDLLTRISSADPGDLLLMEVEEVGNPRRSCDINLYDAGLRMEQVTDILNRVMIGFDVPSARVERVFGSVKDKALGHLSAGVGRDGREFVTVYFGVEAH